MTPADFKTLREALGLSAQWLATAVRVDQRTVRRWEDGALPLRADVTALLTRLDTQTAAEVDRVLADLAVGAGDDPTTLSPEDWPVLEIPRVDTDVTGSDLPASHHRAVAARVRRHLGGRLHLTYIARGEEDAQKPVAVIAARPRPPLTPPAVDTSSTPEFATVEIVRGDGDRDRVPAEATECPHLAIVPTAVDAGGRAMFGHWAVLHVPSGITVPAPPDLVDTTDVDQVRDYAAFLAARADIDWSAADLDTDETDAALAAAITLMRDVQHHPVDGYLYTRAVDQGVHTVGDLRAAVDGVPPSAPPS